MRIHTKKIMPADADPKKQKELEKSGEYDWKVGQSSLSVKSCRSTIKSCLSSLCLSSLCLSSLCLSSLYLSGLCLSILCLSSVCLSSFFCSFCLIFYLLDSDPLIRIFLRIRIQEARILRIRFRNQSTAPIIMLN